MSRIFNFVVWYTNVVVLTFPASISCSLVFFRRFDRASAQVLQIATRSIGQYATRVEGIIEQYFHTRQHTSCKSTNALRRSICGSYGTYCSAEPQNQPIASTDAKCRPMRLSDAAYSSIISSVSVTCWSMVQSRRQQYKYILKLYFCCLFPGTLFIYLL